MRWFAMGVVFSLAVLTSVACTGDSASKVATGSGGRLLTRGMAGGLPERAVFVGAPGRTVDRLANAGAVEFRSEHGSELITPQKPRVGSRFGDAIAEDRIGPEPAELYLVLVGAPGLTVGGEPAAGGVYVFQRRAGEVRLVDLWTQDDPEIPGRAREGARFGSAIAVQMPSWPPGDAWASIGVPGLDVGTATDAGGMVQVRLSNRSGSLNSAPTIVNGHLRTLATYDAGREPRPGDRLGESIMAGMSKVLLGAPHATVAGRAEAGYVLSTLWGDPEADLLHPGRWGLPGAPQAGERFGTAMHYGSEYHPERELLAIGAPGTTVNGQAEAGQVYVLVDSYMTRGWQYKRHFHQDSADDGVERAVSGHAEAGDHFGSAVRWADPYPYLERKVLLVGAPEEDVGEIEDAGAVYGLYGAVGQHEGDTGRAPGADHHFGAAVTSRNHDDSARRGEYYIGIPGADDGAGAVAYGRGTPDWAIDWRDRWTLSDHERFTSDNYGSTFPDSF